MSGGIYHQAIVLNTVILVHKNSDKQACNNSVDPDQMLHTVTSDQGLHCLLLIQQFLDIPSGIKMNLFKYLSTSMIRT